MPKYFDPFGTGDDKGEGSRSGALGKWDVLGKTLDKANPFLISTKDEQDAVDAAIARAVEEARNAPGATFDPLNFKENTYYGDVNWEDIQARPDVQYSAAAAERAALERVGNSEFAGMGRDERLRGEQLTSMEALKEIADAGGMTAQDRANLSRIQADNAQADRGRREAILQNMRARGVGGGGSELLAQLQSSQAATDRQAQQGLDVAGMAQQRALNALMQSGQLAGQVRGQDWDEAAQRAAAMDAIAQFNAVQANNMAQFNTGQVNGMAQFNADNQLRTDLYNRDYATDVDQYNNTGGYNARVGNRDAWQDVSNANTTIQNAETEYNTVGRVHNQYGVEKDQHDAVLGALGMEVDGAKGKLGSREDDKHNKSQAVMGGIGTIVGAMGSGSKKKETAPAAGTTASDERCKKNIKSAEAVDLDHFLAKLKPVTFDYKDEKNGQGPRIGVLAQDMLKTPLGAMAVVPTDEGLALDNSNMMGVALAALKHLSDKIDSKKKG